MSTEKPPVSLHKVSLGEWGSHEIVLPARRPEDAVIVARMLHGLFDVVPFQKAPPSPHPQTNRQPLQLDQPDKLVGYLAELYHRMTLAGPDRRVFAREFDIVEDQIQHLREQGHGTLHPSLRLYDRLAAERRLPNQIIAAGWVRHAPANPPENASNLRKRHVAKFRDLATRAAIAFARHGQSPSTDPSQEEWRALKNEHAHVRAAPPSADHPQAATTEKTYFDRLAERARTTRPPQPVREQDNEPEPSS